MGLCRVLVLFLGVLLFVTPFPLSSVHASPAVIRVTPTGATSGTCGDQSNWSNPCDLQYALTTVAVYGDELWVKEGTYKPTPVSSNQNVSFQLKSGIALYGGFAGNETARDQRDYQTHVTILSGDIDNNDLANPATNVNQLLGTNSYTVVKAGGTDNTAVLDGFTITAGLSGSSGAGMSNISGSLLIQNVVFSGNQADAGAGLYNQNSSPSLHRVTFMGNSTNGDFSHGGGMYNVQSSPTLSDIVFTGNSANFGGGMNNSQSTPILSGVTFNDNTATYGAAIYSYDSSPTVTNATFSNNVAAQQGGAIYNFASSNPVILNVTFSGNQAGADGGGAFYNLTNSNPILRNSILWGDTAPEVKNNSSAPIVDDSIAQGGCPTGATCTNVLTSDPTFSALADNGGFTKTIAIAKDGAAFDAGNDATCALTDQRGIGRPQGAHCDMGAYEVVVNPCDAKPLPPVLKAPVDHATLGKARATLKWNADNCALKYKVLVKDATTGARVDRQTLQPVLKYKTVVLPNGIYKWSLKACDDAGCTKSETRRFTIAQ